LNLLNRRLN